MPNRLLTRDEVYVEIDALFQRMGLKPPQRATSDGTAIGAHIEPPVRESPRPSQYPTSDAYNRALAQYYAQVAACDHCWHTLVETQMCCWCGQPRALQHGPYLPEGDR